MFSLTFESFSKMLAPPCFFNPTTKAKRWRMEGPRYLFCAVECALGPMMHHFHNSPLWCHVGSIVIFPVLQIRILNCIQVKCLILDHPWQSCDSNPVSESCYGHWCSFLILHCLPPRGSSWNCVSTTNHELLTFPVTSNLRAINLLNYACSQPQKNPVHYCVLILLSLRWFCLCFVFILWLLFLNTQTGLRLKYIGKILLFTLLFLFLQYFLLYPFSFYFEFFFLEYRVTSLLLLHDTKFYYKDTQL